MSISSEITRLQNAKAALKTSIENKGVTVDSSLTLDGYAAKVDDISTGGGYDWASKAKQIVFERVDFTTDFPDTFTFSNSSVITCATAFRYAKLPKTVTVNVPACTNFNVAFVSGENNTINQVENITISSNANVTNCENMFNSGYYQKYKTITLNFSTKNVTNFGAFLSNCYQLESILGTPLDFTSRTQGSGSSFFGDGSLVNHVRFVPNTLSTDFIARGASGLDDDSIVSLANCLKAVSGKTLQFRSTIKPRCAQIIGTVSTETDADQNQYDFFTVDAGGTTTLEYFITTTKGWTLA